MGWKDQLSEWGMRLQEVHHIGIAVAALDAAVAFYRDALGLELEQIEEVPDMKVRVAMLKAPNITIELLEPLAGEQAITGFLAKRGPGIHHVSFRVQDLRAATQGLVEKGFHPLYPEPKRGAQGRRVNFLHPKETFGVLVELAE